MKTELKLNLAFSCCSPATGVTDYNTAIRQACNTLAESGLRTVYYASGHSDRIEVAVRRALMTSVSQITQKISEQNAEEFGADGWEISAHVGARPSHAIYQGRQYPNSQYKTIVLPLINDYNCRHSAYPVIIGVTKPSYTEKELAALDPPPFTYQGKQYNAYEAQQKMRYLERKIRKQKDLCVANQGAGQEEAFTAASIKLRRQKDIYEDFCKAAGTYTEYERTFVAGYDRRLGARTGAITRAQKKQKKLQMTLTDLDKGGIIKETKNAAGKIVKIVNPSSVKTHSKPNSITQTVSKKGGINRNFYDDKGNQYLQISNNDHGHKKESKLGKHGEHAHDYFLDENGNTVRDEARELTEDERKENGDIL